MQEISTIPQRAAIVRGRVPGDLLHPSLIRMNGDPGDVHSPALEMDEEQHVVGHQPAQRQHLGGEEVGSRQQRQVRPDEGGPRRRALAFRRRRQAVALQDIANRLIRNLVPEIGQRPRDPVVAPVPVLAGHANDQLLDLPLDPRSARPSMRRAIELAGHELAIPAQDGVRLSYGGDVGQNLATQAMTDLAEHASLGVRQLQPTVQLRLEDAVLRGQVFVRRQQLLIHRPRHVGQDTRPFHNCSLPCLALTSATALWISCKIVPDHVQHRYADLVWAPGFRPFEFFDPTGSRPTNASLVSPLADHDPPISQLAR